MNFQFNAMTSFKTNRYNHICIPNSEKNEDADLFE